MLWLASRSKSRTVYKPLPLGMGFMTQDFAQKTRFLGPSTLRTATQKPGFLPNLSALTKNLGKNPVSRPLPLSATQKPGFLPNLWLSPRILAKTRFLGHVKSQI
jgi:hypothetical protein